MGHQHEDDFGRVWCDETSTMYGPTSDKVITHKGLIQVLQTKLGIIPHGVSIKSGSNLQFTLGNIPEITDAQDKLYAISQRSVWETYLAKCRSACPANTLVYRGDKLWTFFAMKDIVEFIVSSCRWRMLPSGRIKGNFKNASKKASVNT